MSDKLTTEERVQLLRARIQQAKFRTTGRRRMRKQARAFRRDIRRSDGSWTQVNQNKDRSLAGKARRRAQRRD